MAAHWWRGTLPEAPPGQSWPDKPDDASLDAMRDRITGPEHGPLLVERLGIQYREAGMSAPRRAADLLGARARTVTAGHQLCLAGGPAFTYYKILTAIHLAQRLEQRWGTAVVPVFWLASEDHDFEEISRLWTGDRWMAWVPDEATGGPVGRLSGVGLHGLLEEWGGIAGLSDAQRKPLSSGGHPTLSIAMRHWVHALFGPDRIVVLDGDDSALKARFVDVMQREVKGALTLEAVSEWNEVLGGAGFKPQVHVRPCNLFHLGEGGRHRIVQEEGTWRTLGGKSWRGEADLLEDIAADPRQFSPNALLRPVYQSLLLPDVAVVGGMAEVAYWLQIPGVFHRLGLPQPVLVPRDGALVLPSKWSRLMERCGLDASDWQAGKDQWEAQWIASTVPPELRAWEEAVTSGAELTREELASFDAALEAGVKATEAKMKNLLEKLEQQIGRAVKRKESDGLARMARLDEWCRPDGNMQERVCTWFQLAAEWERQGGAGASLPEVLDAAMTKGHEKGGWRPLMHVIRQEGP